MFGFFKSKASKPTNKTTKRQNNKQHNTDESSPEPGSEFSPAQASLIDSFKKSLDILEETIINWDPGAIDEDEFADVIQELANYMATKINRDGEISYVSKKSAKFLAEMLGSALRRGRKMSDVPAIHATLIDSIYSAIDSVQTGLYGDPDVSALDNEYRKQKKQLLKLAKRNAGQNIVIP